YLDRPHDPAPEQLPIAVEVVCRRLEGEILTRELPLLAEAVRNDKEDHCNLSAAARAFVTRCDSVVVDGQVPGRELQGLFSLCEIGSERLAAEIGTDRLTQVASQAVAVAASSLRNQTGTFALVGRLFTVLRMPTLLLYLMARDVFLR